MLDVHLAKSFHFVVNVVLERRCNANGLAMKQEEVPFGGVKNPKVVFNLLKVRRSDIMKMRFINK